jgi:hypothetical protein
MDLEKTEPEPERTWLWVISLYNKGGAFRDKATNKLVLQGRNSAQYQKRKV